MTVSEMPDDCQPDLAPLEENIDHVRGSPGRLIIEYGDYECPYSRRAFHAIELVEQQRNLRGYAAQLGLDVAAFDRHRGGKTVLARIQRDVDSGLASGQVFGTPTLFIDGVVHRGGYDPATLMAALAT